VNWTQFAEAAPELAALAGERFEKTGLILLGSITPNGTPRISPVEPLIVDAELMLGMMWQSKKALDLLRDQRCLIHNTIANKDGTDGEIKLRGRALDVSDLTKRERYGEELFKKINWRPSEPYHLFAIDIESVAFVKSTAEGQEFKMWRADGRNQSRVRKWTGSGYD
jgi:hypothetical protein